jgi:hypothetical protein
VKPAAGYSGKPLIDKLGIKTEQRVNLVGAPPGFTLGQLPDGVVFPGPRSAGIDLILLFVRNRASLHQAFPHQARRLTQAGQLWVAWPKRASGVATDLTEDGVREICLPAGFVDIKVCAIDEIWSGLKLVRRLSHRTLR